MRIQRYKRELDVSYTLGMTLTMELLVSKREQVTRVFVNSGIDKTDSFERLDGLCRNSSIPVVYSDKAFNVLSPKGNCFVIGEFIKYKSMLENGSHIVLVSPSDAGNVGTIIRTAVGFGINNIAVIDPAVDVFDPKTVRASMGALFHVNFTYYKSFDEYRICFPDNALYPFMLNASTNIHEVTYTSPFSLIFGNEASGLSDSFAKLNGSQPILIPHSKAIDSLNLSMAAGIAMFYVTKGNWGE